MTTGHIVNKAVIYARIQGQKHPSSMYFDRELANYLPRQDLFWDDFVAYAIVRAPADTVIENNCLLYGSGSFSIERLLKGEAPSYDITVEVIAELGD
ncbi:MAG: hypothetical protein OXL41_06365 [Nitrospinae bacterium]|nr:hypothetical protein [Nitrospinota bacterium]